MAHVLQGQSADAAADVEEQRREGGAFVVAAETTRMPMIFMDAKTPERSIIFANDSFLRLSGYCRDEVLGRGFDFLMAQGTNPTALAAVEAAFEDEDGHSSEVCIRRKDGLNYGRRCSSVRLRMTAAT